MNLSRKIFDKTRAKWYKKYISAQLNWYPTLICYQLLVYIIKKRKKIYKNWKDKKPDPINPCESTLLGINQKRATQWS